MSELPAWMVWIAGNTGLVWAAMGLAWVLLLIWAWDRERRKRERQEAFGREVFATTAEVRRYGLLEEPPDAPE